MQIDFEAFFESCPSIVKIFGPFLPESHQIRNLHENRKLKKIFRKPQRFQKRDFLENLSAGQEALSVGITESHHIPFQVKIFNFTL